MCFYFNLCSFTVEFMLCKTNGGGWEQSPLFFTMALDEHIVWLTSAISFFPVKVLKLIIRTSGFVLDARKMFYLTPPELTITR